MELTTPFPRYYNQFSSVISSKILKEYKQPPTALLHSINSYPEHFFKYVNSPQMSTSLKKIILVQLVLIHTSNLPESFEILPLRLKSKNVWLNQHILTPYQRLLKKIVLSQDVYQKIRNLNLNWNEEFFQQKQKQAKNKRQPTKEDISLSLIYYTINLLNELLKILKSGPTMWRYYNKVNKGQIQHFINISSFQVILLYFALKFMIENVIKHFDYYIQDPVEKECFKDVLIIQLQRINDDMKMLLLCRYFKLIAKGIRIYLFQLERQPEDIKQLIESILSTTVYTRPADWKMHKKTSEPLQEQQEITFGNNPVFQQSLQNFFKNLNPQDTNLPEEKKKKKKKKENWVPLSEDKQNSCHPKSKTNL